MWLQVNTDSTPGAEPEQAVYQLAEDTVLTVKRDETPKFPVLTWNEGDCNGVQIFRKAYGESGYTKNCHGCRRQHFFRGRIGFGVAGI